MSDVTREIDEEGGELTTARCFVNLGGCCCCNGSHRHRGSATLRGGGNGRHGGTTNRRGRKGFQVGGLATLWFDTFGVGVGGGRGSGTAAGLLLTDDPPCARSLGRDSVGLDFLWIHIPYDRKKRNTTT